MRIGKTIRVMVTVKEWLEVLASSTSSSEQDSAQMQGLLHKLDFTNAVVVLGIVYFEGQGTTEAPPTSIHSVAKMILELDKLFES